MSDQEPKRVNADGSSRRWVKPAITVLLLLAVIVTGTLAFHSRNAWWDKYLSLVH